MNVAEKFEPQIERCLQQLAEDEWALSNARDDVVSELEPHEAFLSVVPVLLLATKQTDDYAFVTCCWVASQLARISGTTECPKGLVDALKKLHAKAQSFEQNTASEAKKIAMWYRVENDI